MVNNNYSKEKIESIIRATQLIIRECNLLKTPEDKKQLLFQKYASFALQYPVVSVGICHNMYNDKAFRMTLNKSRISPKDGQINFFKYLYISLNRVHDKNHLLMALQDGQKAYDFFVNSISYKSDEDLDDIKSDIINMVQTMN